MNVRCTWTGSPTECNYALMTFGIPIHTIPLTVGGIVKLDNHKKWLGRRTAKEKWLSARRHLSDKGNATLEDSFDGIDFPGPTDVLLGRGLPFRNHPGNVRMRQIVDSYRTEYDNLTSSREKSLIIRHIVLNITQGRNDYNDNHPSSRMGTMTVTTARAGRFLQLHPTNGWWVEAEWVDAIEKVLFLAF